VTGTGLLTERCDPYGAESSIRLLGGTVPENQAGKYHWYCDERAESRFRLICRGGEYGERQAPDGGLVAAYHCPGGHRGPVMPLCKVHIREFTAGPPAPGYDSAYRPYGQVGGTKATELCPACAMPPPARVLQDKATALHQELSRWQMTGIIAGPVMRRIEGEMNQVAAAIDELRVQGIVHKCPLELVEVS
jgi:hypothetical protein